MMTPSLTRLYVALFLLMGQGAFISAHAGELMFDHPWLRATAPNAPMAAGYLQITNMDGADDRLVAARADFAKAVEVHEVIKENGVAKMR
ncbi:MAG: copper chaperone PCu(A)C, partial [Candidatus Puniceispirillaceae bacterium]